MDLINKLVPDNVFPTQREAFTNVIKSRGNWYDLIMRVFKLNPEMRTRPAQDPSLSTAISWRGPSRSKTAINTSATSPGPSCSIPRAPATCIARAAGPPRYGHRQNLSFEDIDSIVTSGQSAGHAYVHLHRRRAPACASADLIRICEKHPDCAFLCFTNATLIDEAVLSGYDSRGQLCSRHLAPRATSTPPTPVAERAPIRRSSAQ